MKGCRKIGMRFQITTDVILYFSLTNKQPTVSKSSFDPFRSPRVLNILPQLL